MEIGRREQLVPLDEIDCFLADDGYVIARSAKIEGYVDQPQLELERMLPPDLIRAHRCCLVGQSAWAGMERQLSGQRWVSGAEAHGNGEHRVLFRDGLDGIRVSRRRVAEINGFLRRGSVAADERPSAVLVPFGG